MSIKNNRTLRRFFTTPKIPAGVFLVFLFATVLATWLSAAIGYRETASDLSRHYHIGETVMAPGISFTVETVRRDSVGAGPLTPRMGHEFIVPTVSITNTGATSIDLAPLLHFHVRDRAGVVYTVTAIPSQGAQFSGTILPGDTLREEIGFEVTQSASELTLYFEPGIADRTMIAVDLTEKTSWLPW